MLGYRGDPEKTAETIDPEGWLHTGDIGELDADGYLRIVDRKKELIINAAGKNMSPANIEAAIKSASPLIGQACAIGDRRSYNTALIVLDADFAPMWAAQHGLEGRTLEQLAGEPAVRAAVQEAIDARQHPSRPRRADQEVHDRPRRLAPRRGRADAHDEAQAQADLGEVRRRDRVDVRVAPGVSNGCIRPVEAGYCGARAVASISGAAARSPKEQEADVSRIRAGMDASFI